MRRKVVIVISNLAVLEHRLATRDKYFFHPQKMPQKLRFPLKFPEIPQPTGGLIFRAWGWSLLYPTPIVRMKSIRIGKDRSYA